MGVLSIIHKIIENARMLMLKNPLTKDILFDF